MQALRWPASVLVLLCCVGPGGCDAPRTATVAKDPTDVIIARPTVREVTDYEEFTGHTEAILSVQIRARVTGYLLKKDFQDGQEVHEGDVLYEIDDRPYKTELQRAESTVGRWEAHRVRLELDYRRASNLFEKGAIGKQEFDLISSNYAEAEAQLHAASAQLDVARLNMGFTRVRSPMSGQLSRTLVDPGNLIRQDDTVLNDVISADKLYVYFDLNEEAIQRVRGLIDQGGVPSGPGKEVPIIVGLSDDDTFPYSGVVNFSENKLDAATGTLRVRGVIDNPRLDVEGSVLRVGNWALSPGLFVRVRLPIGKPHPAVLVQDEAVSSDQGRRFVYVVDRDDEVVYRPVDVGPTFDGLRSITAGLTPQERIIVDADGLRRVRPGSKVAPKIIPTKASAADSPAKRT